MRWLTTNSAFLDANVIYPAVLRNVLMHLALHGLFRPRWSARVHNEWIEALLRNRPDLGRPALDRTRALMDAHMPEALVEGYEFREASIGLPDANDRHVLAAAVHCGASVIVTANLGDFPVDVLARFRIRAMHPDPFVAGLIDADRNATVSAIGQLRASYRSPPHTASELLEIMERQGLRNSASALKLVIELL